MNKSAKEQLKRTNNRIKDAARKGRLQAQQNELQYIENLLGEDFESLRQARSALNREVRSVGKRNKKQVTNIVKDVTKFVKQVTKAVPTKKRILKQLEKGISKVVESSFNKVAETFKLPVPKINKKRKAYTLEELSAEDKQSIYAFMQDTRYTEQIDRAFYTPGTSYGAEIPYSVTTNDGRNITGWSKTFVTYPTFNALFRVLSEYAVKASRKGVASPAIKEWLKHIKIVKWSGGYPAWKESRETYLEKHKHTVPSLGKMTPRVRKKRRRKK